MNARERFYAHLVILTLSALALSCGAMSKANRLVTEGNSAVKEGEKYYEQADAKAGELYDALDGFPGNRDQLKDKAQEILDLLDKGSAKLREGAAKFEEGSKTDIDAQLKEYLSLKAQEFNKRADRLEVEKEIPKAVMDNSVEDKEALRAKFIAKQERVTQLKKEWSELEERANKIYEANKDKIKS
ncbi:MAG: hypothetical protein M3362_26920 [Acidobacteriota bacterium]|nr:hypothetical protein [Acidobacteriota bacterium]